MMKKIFSIGMLFAVTAIALTGCKNEEDDLFSSSAAERLSESQKIYTERLGGTTWVMEYYPLDYTELDPETRNPYPNGLGYVILNRFNADGSVEQAMNNAASGNRYVYDTSLWEVIADQGPVLSFNSFNKCIHTFADPGINDPWENLYQGRGYEGDYEFNVINLESDAEFAMLKGKKRGTYVRMSKLPNDTDFETYLQDINNFKAMLFNNSPNNCFMSLGDTTFVFTKGDRYMAEIYPVDGDAISENSDHVYTITKRDGQYYLRFREKIGRGNCDAQEFVYNAQDETFYDVENSEYTIQGYPVGKFYNEYQQSNKWTTRTDASMSDAFKSAMDAVSADLLAVNRNYVFSNINFGYDAKTQKYLWTLRYLSSGRNATAVYYFNFQCNEGDDTCTFSYIEPSDVAAQNVMNRCPAEQNMWNLLSQEWILSAADTKFNLTRIKLTSKTNPDIWFVMNI